MPRFADSLLSKSDRMKGLVYDKDEGYHVSDAVPQPSAAGPGQLLVSVRAVGLNPADVNMPRFAQMPLPPHTVLGFDAAGVVVGVGDGVQSFSVGDRVAYCSRLFTPKGLVQGSFAELQPVDAEIAFKVPPSVAFEDAAAVPCAGLTALMGLKRAQARAGDVVVVLGAAGGVGGFTVQLAKHYGCRVVGVCSGGSAPHVTALGASETIDYTKTADVAARVKELTGGRGADIVVDCVGPFASYPVFDMLAPHGQLVCMVGMPDIAKGYKPYSLGISIHEIMLVVAPPGDKRARDLAVLGDELMGLVASGSVSTMLVEKTTMEGIPAALEKIGTRHVHGKIVAIFSSQ